MHKVLGRFGEERAGGQVRDGVASETWLVVKAELLERLAGREPGCLARISAPEASRAATSRDRTAARYSSWVQPVSQAWSASLAVTSQIRGAFMARE
ncbi:hypothetical protein AB4Y79_07450 [Pseudarthrobacter sp. YAF2]